MPTYLYCLTRVAADAPAPDLRGVDGAPVRGVEESGLRAWVSDVASSLAATPERARAHDVVIRRAMEVDTPLPARFGQLLTDDDTLRREIASHATALFAALARVAGAVEMTLRIAGRSDEPAKSGSTRGLTGTEYLRQVAGDLARENARLERAKFLQRRLAGAVSDVVRAESVGSVGGSRDGSILVISHLVPRESVGEYRRAVRDVLGQEPELPVRVSGPWAPYSFAELGGG
jgi:hypothetical protein